MDALMYQPPTVRSAPAGEAAPFAELCRLAGMRMVVSASLLPDVRIHGEAFDFKAVAPGRVAYCLGSPLLGGTEKARARTALLKLAYAFHDWAAREVVAAHRRRTQHEMAAGLEKLRHALAPTPARVLAHLRTTGALSAPELASDLGIAQPHLSRALKPLVETGLIRCRRIGRILTVEPVRARIDALNPAVDESTVLPGMK